MRKKELPPQHAQKVTADAIDKLANDLGISNEEERARPQDWVPSVIDGFRMHKRDKVERLTPAQQIDLLSAVETETASYAKRWADGRILSMMTLYERARVLENQKLTFEEKVPLLDAVKQSVLDDAEGIVSRLENVRCRVRAMITALEERTSPSIPPATKFEVRWLAEQCFDYWRGYLRRQNRDSERGAADGKQVEKRRGGTQLRFVASVFKLASHELAEETIRTHLSEVRARRRQGRSKPDRTGPLSFDTQFESRREFAIAAFVDLITENLPDFKWTRELAELYWEDLLTGTYGLLPREQLKVSLP